MSEQEQKIGFFENPVKWAGQEWNSSRWTTKAAIVGFGLLIVL